VRICGKDLQNNIWSASPLYPVQVVVSVVSAKRRLCVLRRPSMLRKHNDVAKWSLLRDERRMTAAICIYGTDNNTGIVILVVPRLQPEILQGGCVFLPLPISVSMSLTALTKPKAVKRTPRSNPCEIQSTNTRSHRRPALPRGW
jgi:hypothetical protein